MSLFIYLLTLVMNKLCDNFICVFNEKLMTVNIVVLCFIIINIDKFIIIIITDIGKRWLWIVIESWEEYL